MSLSTVRYRGLLTTADRDDIRDEVMSKMDGASSVEEFNEVIDFIMRRREKMVALRAEWTTYLEAVKARKRRFMKGNANPAEPFITHTDPPMRKSRRLHEIEQQLDNPKGLSMDELFSLAARAVEIEKGGDLYDPNDPDTFPIDDDE